MASVTSTRPTQPTSIKAIQAQISATFSRMELSFIAFIAAFEAVRLSITAEIKTPGFVCQGLPYIWMPTGGPG